MVKNTPKKRKGPRISTQFIKRLSSWLVLSTALTLAVRSASSLFWDADQNATGNVTDGTNLGGTGTWDLNSTANWWDGSSASDTQWQNGDAATFVGPSGTVTLGTPIIASGLTFNSAGFTLAGTGSNVITLNAQPATVDGRVNPTIMANASATISAGLALNGSQNWTVGPLFQRLIATGKITDALNVGSIYKTGNGTLVLGNANASTTPDSFSGMVTVVKGLLIVRDPSDLGTGTSTVQIGGDRTLGGGTLLLAPTNPFAPTTFNRNFYVQGGGVPTGNVLNNGGGLNALSLGALSTVGPITINGSITTSSFFENRITATFGPLTLNGPLVLGGTQDLVLYGAGNIIINGQVQGAGRLVKTQAGSLGITLWLTNTANASTGGLTGDIRIDNGTVRVSDGRQLGASTTATAIRFNGGTLEVRADAAAVPTFLGHNVSTVDNNGTIYLDRAIGGSSINQTVTFGAFQFGNSGRTLTLNGRDGYSFSIGSLGALFGNSTGNNFALTTGSINGLTTFNGNTTIGDSGGVRNLTFTTTGDAVWNGSLQQNAGSAVPAFIKSGAGTLFLYTSNSNVNSVGTTASTTLTVASNVGIAVGQSVSGTGVPVGTTVLAINGNTVTLSQAAGVASGGAVVFAGSINTTASATTLSNTMTLANTAGLTAGELVSGAGVASGTIITAINGNTVTLSQAAGVVDATSLSFGGGTATTSSAATTNVSTITVASAAGISVGEEITGAGIPAGSTVTAIAGNVLTLDHLATVSSGAALSFGGMTITGGTTINGGTLVVNQIGGASGGSLNGVAGGVLNISSAALNYVGAQGTGDGETTAKVINLNNTGSGLIFANQTGSGLVLTSNIASAGSSGAAKTLFIGGVSTATNTINGVYSNTSVSGVSTLFKVGTGTWLYSPLASNYVDPNPSLVGATTTTSAGTAVGNATLTVTSSASFVVGQAITGTNLPPGAFIASIPDGTHIVLNTTIPTTAVASGITIGSSSLAAQVATTASAGANTNVITVASTAGLVPGQVVTGSGIPSATVITSIVDATHFTISTALGGTVNSGTTISFGAVQNFTGDVQIAGGTLQIQPTAATGHGSDVINDTSRIVFLADTLEGNTGAYANGTFEYLGLSGANTSETVGQLILSGGSNVVKVTPVGAGGGATLTFNGSTLRLPGTSVNFVTSTGNIVLNSAPIGLVGGFAYYNGADFAYVPSVGGALRAPVYGTDAGFSPVDTIAANTNVMLATSQTLASSTTLSSLKMTGAGTTLTLASGQTLTLDTGAGVASGILVSGGNSVTITGGTGLTAGSATAAGGGTTSGNPTIAVTSTSGLLPGMAISGSNIPANTVVLAVIDGTHLLLNQNASATGTGITFTLGSDLVFRTDSASDVLTLSTPITNTTNFGITKDGAGTLILNGAQAYNGTTTINEGTIQLGVGSRLGGGAVSNNNNLVIRGGATLDVNGQSIGVAGFNGAGVVTNSGGSATLTIGNNNQGGTFDGVIQNGAGTLGLTKASGNTIALTGVNTFTGPLTMAGGTLQVTQLTDIGVAGPLGRGNTSNNAGSLIFNGGILQYTGAQANIYQTTQSPSVSFNRLFSLQGNGTFASDGTFGNVGNGTGGTGNNAAVIFNNTAPVAFIGTGTRTLTLQGGSQGDNEFDPQLINNPNGGGALSLTKAGSGLWILNPATSNTYSGATTITGGALQVAPLSAAVQGLSANSNLVLNGGVLQTTGLFNQALGTGAGQVNLSSAFGASGFSSSGVGASSRLVVSLGGGATITWGTPTFNLSTLLLSNATALGEVEFANNMVLNGQGVAATPTVTTNNGSATITITAGTTTGLQIGQVVTGTNIPAGSIVTSIVNGTQFTISANATASGTGISANIAAGGFRNIQVDDNGNANTDYAIASGVISGTGSLGKSGTGILWLTGNNTFTGSGTATAGTGGVIVANGTIVISGFGNNSALGALTPGGTDIQDRLVIGAAGNTGSVIYVGNGETVDRIIELAGTGGTSRIENDGSGPLIIQHVTNTTTGAKSLDLRGTNVELNILSANLSNNGSNVLNLQKNDSGLWELSGNNSGMTGVVTINGGVLIATNSSAFGTGTLQPGNAAIEGTGSDLNFTQAYTQINNTTTVFAGPSNITLSGQIQQTSGNNYFITNSLNPGKTLTLAGAVTNGDTGTARTLQIQGVGTTVITGQIKDPNTTAKLTITYAGGATVNVGPGTLQLHGSVANTFAGGLNLSSGILDINMPGNLTPLGTGIFASTGTAFLQSEFDMTSTGGGTALTMPVAFGNPSNTSTGQGNLIVQGAHNFEFTGNVTSDDNSNTLTANGVNVKFSGASFGLLGNQTSRTFTVTGIGNVEIVGSIVDGGVPTNVNTTTTAGNPTVVVASATGLVVGQLVTGTGILPNTFITAISGTNITLNQAPTSAQTNTSMNFAAVGSLTKSGTGTLTLDGNSTYRGTTTINDGILQANVTGSNTPLSPSGLMTLAGGTLNLSRTDALTSTQTTGNISFATNTSSHVAINSGSGTLNLTTGNLVRNAGQNATVEFTLPTSGTVTIGNASAMGGWATVQSASGNFFATRNASNNLVALTSTVKNDVSTWVAGDNVTDDHTSPTTGYHGTFTLGIGVNTIRFDGGSTNSTVTIGDGYTLNVSNNGILVTSNVGAGNALITGGTLGGNASVLASQLVSGSSTITVGSTAGLAVGMSVSGLNNAGSANMFPTGTVITAILDANTVVVSGASAVNSNGLPQSVIFGTSELDVTQNNLGSDFTIASAIRQPDRSTTAGVPVAVVKAGPGTLVLSGNNSYNGTTQINEGTIKVGSATAIGSFNVGNNIQVSTVNLANKPGTKFDLNGVDTTIGNLSGGGTDGGLVALGTHNLTLDITGSTTYAGAITGSGNLILNGGVNTATLTLNTTANSSFTGQVIIGNAILALNNGTVFSGQTLSNLMGATSFTIQNGGGLLIDNNGSLPVSRISSTAPITLSNTAPSGTAPNVGLSTQTDQSFTTAPRIAQVGSVTLVYGENTVRAAAVNTATGANPILDMASLSRGVNNATLAVLANNLDTPLATLRGDVLVDNSAPIIGQLIGGGSQISGTPNISILPWAMGQAITTNTANAAFVGNAFVTYSTTAGFGNGFRALTNSEYEQWTPTGGTTLTNNVRYAGTTDLNLTGLPTTVPSIAANVSTITVASAAGMFVGQNVTDFSGTIPFGTKITAINGNVLTLSNNTNFAGTNVSLTMNGHQMNALLLDSTGATGNVNVTGNGSNDFLNVQSGAFLFLGTQPITVSGFGDGFSSGITTGTNNEYIFHVQNTAAAGVTISSALTTPNASLTKDGVGTLIFGIGAFNSGLTGNIYLNQGLLGLVGSTNGIGGDSSPGQIILQGGGLMTPAGGSFSTSRNLVLNPGGPSSLAGAYNLSTPLSGNTIDAEGTATITLDGQLVDGTGGPGGLTKTGTGFLTLEGGSPNTNTGLVGVFEGTLNLSKPGGPGFYAIGSGGLSINTSSTSGFGTATAVLLADQQIDPTATVTIYSNGTGNIASLNLNNHVQTIGSATSELILGANTGSGVLLNTGATGTLILGGDLVMTNNRDAADGTTNARGVLITGSGNTGTVSFDGTLDLGGAVRNITVTSTASLAGQGPINGAGNSGGGNDDGNRADATIETVVTDGGINKLGNRVLRLTNNNTYSDVTTIREGAIRISSNQGLGIGDGSAGTGTTVYDGASLQLENNIIVGNTASNNELLTLFGNGALGTGAIDSVGGANVWKSQITLGSNTSFGADGTGELVTTGIINGGSFDITKVGTGAWLYDVDASSTLGNLIVANGYLAVANDASGLHGKTPTILSGGGIGLFWDGNGTGESENYTFPAFPANFQGNFGIEVSRTGLPTANGLYTTPSNKRIQYDLANLPTIANQVITVNNANGYSLVLTKTGALDLTNDSPNFNVVNATASNLMQGLILTPQITGSNVNLIKSGNGTLVLANSTSSFTGKITINSGVLAAGNGNNDDDSQLGAASNEIILSPTSGTSTFRATDNMTFNTRVIQLANTANARAIEVVVGKTLTLNTAFDLNSGAGTSASLVKNDNGTLVINASNPTWAGTTTINAGIIQITNPTALGIGAINIAPNSSASGASLQLSSATGFTLPNAILLQGNNNQAFGGINFGGQLENVSGNNTTTGLLTTNFDAAIGADAGSTININGGINDPTTSAHAFIFTGAGTINLNSAITSATATANQYFSYNKYGTGTLNITFAEPTIITSNLTFFQGTTNFTGAGSLNHDAVTAQVFNGATLVLDNSGTIVNNRLGSRAILLTEGSFNFIGNATTATGDSMTTLQMNGEAHFTITNNGAPVTETFTGFTQNTGSSMEWEMNGGTLGGTDKILFTGAPGLTNGLLSRTVVINGSNFDFGTYNSDGKTANTNGVQAFATYNTSNNLNLALATDTMKITSNAQIFASRTLNALAFNGDGLTVTGAPASILTLTSGGLLVTGATSTGDTLNIPVISFPGTTEGQIHINTGSTLTLGSAIIGTAGLNKSNGGNLLLTSPQYYSGNTWLNDGELQLVAHGTNTLLANQSFIGNGGTLDLNGGSQYIGQLSSAIVGAGSGTFAGAGSTITSTLSGATLVTTSNTNSSFGGLITGSLSFNKAGTYSLAAYSNENFTGATVINGGVLNLLDSGSLSATTSIEIDNATLQINNQGILGLADRINDSAPVTLNSGNITFLGRQQTASTETLGNVTLASGINTIQVSPGGTGVNSATLTLTSLQKGATQAGMDAMLNISASTALGTMGSTPQLLIPGFNGGAKEAFLGGWAIVTTSSTTAEFAGYDPVLGIGALNAPGFAGYDAVFLPATSQPTQNIRTTTNIVIPGGTGVLQVNSLNMVGNINVTFNSSTDTIDLTSGGLLKSGNFGNTFGTNPGEGNLTAGNGSGLADLYIYSQQNNFFLNSNIIDNGPVGGPALNPVRLVLAGSGLVTLKGFNSYTGGTVIDGVSAVVSSYLPPGGVTVNNGTLTVAPTVGGNTGIDPANTVTLNNGQFTFSGTSSLAGLNLNTTGAGTTLVTINLNGTNPSNLILTGDITATPTSVGTLAAAATIGGAGNLDLGSATRTVNVAPTLINGVNVAPLQPGLIIGAQITDHFDNTTNPATFLSANGIVKTGAGVLQLGVANTVSTSTFSGGVDLQVGSLLIAASSTPASGATVTSGPLGTGTLTIHDGTTLLAAQLTGGQIVGVGNAYTIQGLTSGSTSAAFTFDGPFSLQLNGALSISSATPLVKELDISVINPNMTAALGGAIDSKVTNIVKSGLGTLVVNPNYQGTITVDSGAISLFADGDGTSTPQFINFNTLTLQQPSTISVGRLGTSFLPYFTLASNKTIELVSLVTNGNPVTVNNQGVAAGPGNGGYGLQVDGDMALGADQTFNVSTATASNVVQGLTLNGVVSGNVNLVKGGNGTLVLGNAGNTFGGAGKSIDIQGGVVAISNDLDLGDSNNVVNLDVIGAQTNLFGLRATDNVNLASTRIINLGQANNGIEVVAGKTLTVNHAFTLSATTNTLFKNDAGVLELAADNSATGWSNTNTTQGGINIASGAVRLSANGAAGASTNLIIVSPTVTGAALQLNGGITVANPIVINNSTATNQGFGGINFGGELENFGGTNTTNGVITMFADADIGADAGSVLNINGTINNPTTTARALIFTGDGTINLNSNATAGTTTANQYFSINKYGQGTLNITTANAVVFTNNFTVFQGKISLNGAGALTLGTNIAATVNPGATLELNDLGTNATNRLGGRGLTLVGGNFNLIGNASANTSDSMGTPTFNRGYSIITVTAQTGEQANLKFTATNNSVAPAQSTAGSGASILFRGTNLAATATAGSATISDSLGFTFNGQTGGTGQTSKGIMPWALVDTSATGNGLSFATTDGSAGSGNGTANAGIRVLAANEYVYNTVTANNNVLINTGTVSLTAAPSSAANSFTFDNSANLSMSSLVPLSNSSGGILVRNGSSSISGGFINQTNGFSPLNIWTLGNLTINSVMNGGNGFGNGSPSMIKAGAGTLTLSAPASYVYTNNSGNTLTGLTIINGGTLKLNSGTNTLSYNNFLEVGLGGTLDLNGNSQYVEGLFTDGALAGTGGTITGDANSNSTLIVNADNTTRNFAGNLTGALSFQRSGQNTLSLYSNSDYTGITQISGGVTVLRDKAQLSGTTQIDLNYATLLVDNNVGVQDLSDRINDTAAINLRGGSLTVVGRAQTASSEKLGVVTAMQGYSTILANAGAGPGPASVDVTLQKIAQGNVDGVLNFNGQINGGSNGQTVLGLIGSNPRIEITDVSNLTNLSTTHIIGGWAVVNGTEFAAYNATYGVGALTQAGFAGYDFNQSTLPLTVTPTQNLRLTASTTIPDAGLVINALSLRGTFDTNMTTNAVLNVVSGGFIANQTSNRLSNLIGQGYLTAGGSQTSGIAPLYLYNTANTYTINANVIDTAVPQGTFGPVATGAHVRLIISATGGAVSLASANNGAGSGNSYTGGTVLNGGTLNLATPALLPGFVIPNSNPNAIDPTLSTSGLIINGGTVTELNVGGQIGTANIVTLNGNSTLNLVGNTNQLAGGHYDTGRINDPVAGTNTLAGLVFNDNGGGATNPIVNTGGGTFTATGLIPATVNAPGVLALTGDVNHQAITSNPSNVGSIATVAGRITFSTDSNEIITVNPYNFNVNDVAPIQSGLNIQGIIGTNGFIKQGLGVLGLSGQQIYTGLTDVQQGTIAIEILNGGSRYSDYQLDAGTFFNLNAISTAIGSLTGSGTVFNSSGITNATLQVGFDNTNSTFSGQFSRFSDGAAGTLFVQKIGTGTWNLTGAANTATSALGNSGINGGLAVNQGEVLYNGNGTGAWSNYTVNAGGTLVLDNSGTNINNRLGWAGGTATIPSISLVGGRMDVIGNASAPTTETAQFFANSTSVNGMGILNLGAECESTADLREPRQLGLHRWPDAVYPRCECHSGQAVGAGQAVYTWPLMNFNGGQGSLANGTVTTQVRPDIVLDPQSNDIAQTNTGIAFSTKDSVTGIVRPLAANEMQTAANFLTSGSASTTNYSLNAGVTIVNNQSSNTIRLENGGGISIGTASNFGLLNTTGGVITETLNSNGIIALQGNNGINVGALSVTQKYPVPVLGGGGLDHPECDRLHVDRFGSDPSGSDEVRPRYVEAEFA
ncbi:autotransporter-associated beta strand repeat protein [Chthoniobacter flavus Ellin428]|uniref:Autotransporter-associated beta strand repeat protein n=1 Tax=Chthoniobacter flavus Ellin428 TaxID=497964 RepID=B4CYN9_9BACT|nr:autotransporter-associated beta strand repeat-containing protein [Chthoniobacter flavus]EDY20580.1 autotransporter-associated beta strand repeat protein [Chthoniobacter flavus Ellin428]